MHQELANDGGGTPLMGTQWKMAPGEASHEWQCYGGFGTWALLEKDDLDHGVIGNPTKATKEKDDALVERVVEGYIPLARILRVSVIRWASTVLTATSTSSTMPTMMRRPSILGQGYTSADR